jgi:mycofactocin precursor
MATQMATTTGTADDMFPRYIEDRDKVTESLIEEISIDGMCGVYSPEPVIDIADISNRAPHVHFERRDNIEHDRGSIFVPPVRDVVTAGFIAN